MVYLDKGYIGCFELSDYEPGKRQLEEYIAQLKSSGHKRIIAPIDGNTWHKYRLVSWDSGFRAFPLEPQNPIWYNDVYLDCGFTPLAKYFSVAFDINKTPALSSPLFTKESIDKRVTYKKFEPSDLKTIYDISLAGFDNNFLYDEITFDEFSKLYEPLLPMVDGDFVLIAYVDDMPCGFMFAIGIGDIFILKSIAVLPEYRKFGIGNSLINKVLLAAKEKGYKTAIGALIIDGNISRHMLEKYGAKKIREYTLYQLEV